MLDTMQYFMASESREIRFLRSVAVRISYFNKFEKEVRGHGFNVECVLFVATVVLEIGLGFQTDRLKT